MKNSFIQHSSQEPQPDHSVRSQPPPATVDTPTSDKPSAVSQPPSETSRRPVEHRGEGATSVAIKSPRQRINSLSQVPGHRSETSQSFTFTSPLAQIYQPLVVDDDLVVEDTPADTSVPSVQNAYMRRRRLSSMHRFPPTDPHISHNAVALKRFPTTTSSVGRAVPENAIMETPESVTLPQPDAPVPEAIQLPPLMANLPSLSQIEDEEDRTGAVSQVASRLDRIEERQKSLENLLQEIAQRLRSVL